MLSCEIKVNGAMVGHIYARNITGSRQIHDDVHHYLWEYYRPEQRSCKSGKVNHTRDNGIEALIALILAEVGK